MSEMENNHQPWPARLALFLERRFNRVRCLLGRHNFKNDGNIRYESYRSDEEGKLRLVQRCDRDYCWKVRFL